ncbi:hypothetical protein DSECCO2_183670 [anaerobic digester metagenome]
MDYATPIGQEAQGEAAIYIDGNPEAGIEGSAVPAKAIEPSMRELIHLIRFAGLTPSGTDLEQVRKAIGMLIESATPGLATLLQPGLVMPDGSTTTVNTSGILSSLGATSWSETVDYTSPILVIGPDGAVYKRLAASGPGVPGVGAKTPGAAGSEDYWRDLAAVVGGYIPYTLPAGELNLYVRTDGSDANDGLSNTAAGAFATLERAAQWVRERRFYGTGYISIRIADGTYMQTAGGYNFATTFVDAAPFWFASDLYQTTSRETYRVRVIGNVATPANVLINLSDTQSGNALSSAHFYGLSFKYNGSSLFRDNVASISSATITNCRFVIGTAAKSPFYVVFRCSGSEGYFSGAISVIFEAAKQCEAIFAVGNGAYFIGAYSHDVNGNARNINGNIAVTGSVTVNATVEVTSDLRVLPGAIAPCSFTGSGITGSRYYAWYPGSITTNGYGASFFPGTSAGVATMPASTLS